MRSNIVVTGGDTSAAASVYLTEGDGAWQKLPDMGMSRGYQSSVALSDGNIFQIGGSWNDDETKRGGKDGEIFDLNGWSPRPGAKVEPMITGDVAGVYRADNHAWLFAWRGSTAFQAGPSKQMHWYSTTGEGDVTDAGARGDDNDAMCGTATMYDAMQGKILTVGGAPDYEGSSVATGNANIITIGNPGDAAEVQGIGGMEYPRTYHSSVVLPDGKVLITGGTSIGKLFSDETATRVPEIWDWATGAFTSLAEQPRPRTYHSVAVLLNDGRVFSGGGGLCGDECPQKGGENHFDGEIFTPPYLLDDNGNDRERPQIEEAPQEILAGDVISVRVNDMPGDMTFSLVRYGSSTHTVNTDQRRVPLDNFEQDGTTYNLATPNDTGILTPGYWMLFAMRDGTPSVASTIRITL